MNKMEVSRFIAQYSAVTDQLVAEYALSDFKLKAFQQEFSEKEKSNLMYDCYSINAVNTGFLRKYLNNEPAWNFEKYRYFLEAHSI